MIKSVNTSIHRWRRLIENIRICISGFNLQEVRPQTCSAKRVAAGQSCGSALLRVQIQIAEGNEINAFWLCKRSRFCYTSDRSLALCLHHRRATKTFGAWKVFVAVMRYSVWEEWCSDAQRIVVKSYRQFFKVLNATYETYNCLTSQHWRSTVKHVATLVVKLHDVDRGPRSISYFDRKLSRRENLPFFSSLEKLTKDIEDFILFSTLLFKHCLCLVCSCSTDSAVMQNSGFAHLTSLAQVLLSARQ